MKITRRVLGLFTGFMSISGVLYAQNPGVSIATFKNDATGAYNIIHDDFGDYAVIGINDYVDTMTFNRNIKITFGAITSSCEGNPGMYAKAKVMINEHNHEIINHSHTHSCALASSSCGGTGSSYQWGEAGNSAKLDIEVNKSTQSIFNNTGVQPRFFIYPYDQFTSIANARLESLGYIGARTGAYNAASANTLAPSATGFFQTPLVVDASDNGSGMVIAKNLNYWVDQAINNKQWVNRELHNVGNSGWGSVDVATYRNHLNYVKQKMDAGQLWVGTISEMLTYQMQKQKYTPSSVYTSANKTITVNWNTPTFNVEQYLQPLKYKSPITLKVDVSNAAHAGNYNISQNGIAVTDFKKVGTNLLINVYPHSGPVQIKIVDCATLCIATQPSSTTVTEGTLLTLTAQASAPSGAITYQWYKNNFILNDQTGATLSIAAATLADAGNYKVVITNGANSLTSSIAVVTIIENPCLRLCISSQPANTSVNIGTAATFSVNTQGIQPVTYQWYKDNVPMSGQTNATLTIAATTAGDAATYKVVVTNSSGSVTSSNAALTLYNQTPYSGTPIAIPGKIEAEHFDNGGQNIAYYDNTPGSQFPGVTFRNDTDVDINVCTDGGPGYNIGYFASGEWLEYTVNVAATANYNFIFRTASVNDGQPNGTIKLDLDGQTVLASQSVVFTGNWTTYSNVTASNVPLTAGVHTLRLTAVNGNFDLNYIQVNASSLLLPTITFNDINKTYGDGTFTANATSNSGGAITYSATGTGATVSPNGLVTITGAGTVTITASQAANGSFSGSSTTSTLTIAKKELQVVADDKERSFNTANPAFTVKYNGFAGTDNTTSLTTLATATTTATISSPAGNYNIVPSGAVADNYTFSYFNGNLKITPVTPTITFANISKTYGDAVFNLTSASASSGTITYTATGTGATVTQAGLVTITGAGTVTITATQAASGSYNSATVSATLSIAKKGLVITADNKSKTFNTVNPTLTVSYSGFVGADNDASLTIKPTVSTVAVTSSPAGLYDITVSGGTSANYTFTYVKGRLTINPAAPTITFANINKIYGEPAFNVTATSNSAGTITYSVSGTGVTVSSSGLVTITGVGSATITATQAANGSYSAGSKTATITIGAAPINGTITFSNASSGVKGSVINLIVNSPSAGTVTYTVVNNSGSATVAGNQLTLVNAGTVTVTANIAANGNYAAGSATQVITITNPVLGNPVVALTNPLPGSTYEVNSQITLIASFSTPNDDATITSLVYTITNTDNNQSVTVNGIAPNYSGIWTPNTIGNYIVTASVTDSKGAGGTSGVNSITVTQTTGIDDFSFVSEFNLYPVPAADELNLGFTLLKASKVKIDLVDIESGSIVVSGIDQEFAIGSHELSIPVKHLANGIYLAKIYTNNHMHVKKVTVLN